jgi:ribosomal protein L29
MSMRDLLGKLARIDESMTSAAKKPTGPEFVGKWKGTDSAAKAKSKLVGGGCEESILKDLEKALTESPARDLKEEYKQYSADWCQRCGQSPCNCTTVNEGFNSKQEVIDHFVKQGKSAAAGAAAWERGWRGQQAKPTNMNNFKFKKPPTKSWQELDEYGGTGGYGAASQAPAGTTAQDPDPAAQQAKTDATQIQKSTNQLAATLNAQGAAQPLNKVKFSDTMTKLDDKPNTQLSAQELQQMTPMAVAASKALQNPQTASQMKQLISKADTVDKQKELKVQQAQQKVGTNQPSGQQPQQSTNAPQQNTLSAGQVK